MNFFFGEYKAALIVEAEAVINQAQAAYTMENIGNLTEENQISEPKMEANAQKKELPQAKIKPVAALQNVLPEKELIDVPDNGDCLFGAISAGMKLNYPDIPKIQNKLNWIVDSAALKGNLKLNEKILEGPCRTLRMQANDFLRANYLEFMIELIGAIMEHNDAIQAKINKYFSNSSGLDENAAQCIENGIEDDQKNLLAEDDFEGYLNLSKEKGFFCGNAEIAALSSIYEIPIEVKFENGRNSRTFNLTKSRLPPLILQHENNHFLLFSMR